MAVELDQGDAALREMSLCRVGYERFAVGRFGALIWAGDGHRLLIVHLHDIDYSAYPAHLRRRSAQ